MKKFMMNALLVSTFLSSNSVSAFDKIVGGEAVTDLKETPYMVSLSGVCGGSIISSRWVLTAAHCAGYFYSAKGGVLNLRDRGHNYDVKRVIKHPEYNPDSMANDFALVELKEEINFNKTGLAPVKLASPSFEQTGAQSAGVDSTVYGFGNIGEGQSNYGRGLNKVVVPIVSNEEANRADAYNGQIDDTMLAAGYAGGGKDSCQGDSGGPLVVFDGQNEAVQIGVVSWGEGCARENKYGIYSKISSAYEWINQTISSK